MHIQAVDKQGEIHPFASFMSMFIEMLWPSKSANKHLQKILGMFTWEVGPPKTFFQMGRDHKITLQKGGFFLTLLGHFVLFSYSHYWNHKIMK